MLQVPQFDFTTLNFAATLQPRSSFDATGLQNWAWAGPSQPAQHLALAVMGLGQILPITPPAHNASWTLDFWGPALQCNDVAATERDKIWINIWNSYSANFTGSYAFLSWVPWSNLDFGGYFDEIPVGLFKINLTASGTDRDLPFLFNVTESISRAGPPSSSVSTDGAASLLIAVLPNSQNLSAGEFGNGTGTWSSASGAECRFQMIQNLTGTTPFCEPASVYKGSTLLRCDLVNTSYSVEFSYSSGAQNIRVSPNMNGSSPIVNTSAYFSGPIMFHDQSNISEPANCSSFQTSLGLDDEGTPCAFEINAVRLLSYQGIMAAFNQVVIGAIQYLGDIGSTDTTIMKTILAQTEELAPIRDFITYGDGKIDLQILMSSSTGWAYAGLANSKPPETRGDLKSTLEQLFQNFTISLLAEPYFQ